MQPEAKNRKFILEFYKYHEPLPRIFGKHWIFSLCESTAPINNWIKLDFDFNSRNVIFDRLLQTVIAATRFDMKGIYLLGGLKCRKKKVMKWSIVCSEVI